MSDSENIDNENLPQNEMDLKDEINRYINQNKEEVIFILETLIIRMKILIKLNKKIII